MRRTGFLLACLSMFFVHSAQAQFYTAVDDLDTLDEDGSVTVFVLENDINTTGFADVFIDAVSTPLHGAISVAGDLQSITYTPNENYNGLEIFNYTGCANVLDPVCSEGTVILTINPLPDAPIAVDDYENTFVNTPFNITPLSNDDDVDAEGLELDILDDATHGATTIVGGNTIYYEPFFNYLGGDTIQYLSCKLGYPDLCDTAFIYITVESVNFNAPLAQDDTITTDLITPILIDVLANDFDGDGDALTVTTLFTAGVTGVATILDNAVSYTPASIGTDIFLYVVCDNNIPVRCDTAQIKVKVVAVDEPPVNLPLHVPDSFSPNNDGINDVLVISGLENYASFNLKIYNRWSDLVYENDNKTSWWDGKSNVNFISQNGDVPEGTYFYILTLAGEPDPLRGYIVIKR
ncbi:MAG: Ig-like domain-containing protein [Chitinophagales bacterium]